MKITVIGTGYVGLVSGACLAEMGNEVVCMDINLDKVKLLSKGVSTFYEPGLQELIENNLRNERLGFTGNLEHALRHGDAIFIAVDTPSDARGGTDLRRLHACLLSIGLQIDNDKTVVIKSTVPVGTSARAEQYLSRLLEKRSADFGFELVYNPEFLREGSAVSDFMQPDRIVVGTKDSRGADMMKEAYRPLCDTGCPMLITGFESAEMIKHASNAFLATKIAFINEMSDLCRTCGANVQEVAAGIGMDRRIGSAFLQAGPGFGGSCLPKDARALVRTAQDFHVDLPIVRAVMQSNEERKERMMRFVVGIAKKLQLRRAAVLGAAYKANTDDVRESPAIEIICSMSKHFEHVRIWDPQALGNARRIIMESNQVSYAASVYNAVENAEMVVILTEWPCFKELDYGKIKSLMQGNTVVDLRNLLDRKTLERQGFAYYGLD